MKHIKKMILVFVLILSVVYIGKVSAETITLTPNWTDVTLDDSLGGTNIVESFLEVTPTGDDTGYNTIRLKLTLENLTLVSVDLRENWYYTKINDNEYLLETTENHIIDMTELGPVTGYGEIGVFNFTKTYKEKEYRIDSDLTAEKADRTCSIFHDNYYGRAGLKTDLITYVDECNILKCDKKDDGTYTGIKGNIVNEATYKSECLACQKKDDGTFTNKLGEPVNEIEYKKDCEKLVCTILEDGTYYDEKGNIVNKDTYESACTNPNTGSFIPYVITSGVFLSLIGIVIFTHNKTKIYKM